jgi:hypothetical protein
VHITYPIDPLERDTCHPLMRALVTPIPSTCQPLVHALLAKVVGEVNGTPGVRDFGTSEGLGCSIVERLKGTKAGATWQAYETSRVQEFGRFHA